jgi:hypothetical protein
MKKLRGIQDYQQLNEIMIKDCYPLPLISEVIGCLSGCRYFSKMDLWWGFNNMRIREGDKTKAAFIMPKGLFELTVMQFSLCNAPATFQWMVDTVLVEEIESGHVEVYMDDILVHTADRESN